MKRDKAHLLRKINGAQMAALLSASCRLGVFDLLPATCQNLSETLSINPITLKRLLSALIALDLIEESEGIYSTTEQGAYLREDHKESLKNIALYKTAPFMWEAYGKLFDGFQTDHSPFELAHGSDLFSFLDENPNEASLYHEAMTSFERYSSDQILDECDFSKIETLIDVGGGQGSFLKRILERHPHIKGEVFDRAHGDFFVSVPKGASGYILRSILHDWCDEKCVQILKTVKKSMGAKSRLFIFETFIDKESRVGKFADITLLATTPGGKERTQAELETLIKKSGLQIKKIVKTAGSKGLIEVTLS